MNTVCKKAGYPGKSLVHIWQKIFFLAIIWAQDECEAAWVNSLVTSVLTLQNSIDLKFFKNGMPFRYSLMGIQCTLLQEIPLSFASIERYSNLVVADCKDTHSMFTLHLFLFLQMMFT